MTKLTKNLQQDEKIVQKIYVNGKRVEESDFINIKKLSVIEVLTRTYTDILIDSLYYSKEYIQDFLSFIKEEKFGREEIEMFLGMLSDLIFFLESKGIDDFFPVEELEFIDVLNGKIIDCREECENVYDLFYLNSIDDVMENLKISVVEFYSKIDKYCNLLLENEKNKKILN